MTASLFPGERVQIGADSCSLLVDEEIYPLEAVYGAAYVFMDRCFIHLDRPEPARLRITLADKDGDSQPEQVRDLAGQFANELLTCAWRRKIAVDNRAVIEATTMQAMAGALGPASLEDLEGLEDFEFGEGEEFDDPLGIAVSWEEKYGKD